MDPERWDRVKKIFDEVVDLSPERRDEALNLNCEGDPELRREIESLLSAHFKAEQGASFLGAEDHPEQIGPFLILRLIGRGGMGVVYLGEQIEPIRRKAAVKLIQIGMDTREVVARFETERQALALMTHPHIASIFDAGATDQGRPWFAMEYVPGVPITEYCDTHHLDTVSRLRLFQKVCEAIQHAHQKGIIHRDIKPSNILVSHRDGDAVPKVIDFGIAKATTLALARSTLYTRTGLVIGTPEYVSPEQASMTEAGVDTRTDVYSLGVLLYELLTGQVPFGRTSDAETPFDEILRRVRLEEPSRPSLKLSSLGNAAATVAEARRTDRATLEHLLRRDLDWIILKALEKDPGRRYGSPVELAADIERYLTDQPVTARPPSRAYLTAKFVRRHRVGVAVAATLFAILAGATATISVLAVRTAHERDRAERAARTAEDVTSFMIDMFSMADPNLRGTKTITAEQILENASAKIVGKFGDRPAVHARLLTGLAVVHRSLSDYDEALRLANESLALQEGESVAPDDDHVRTLLVLSQLHTSRAEFARAEPLARKAIDIAERMQPAQPGLVAKALDVLAQIHRETERWDEAEQELQRRSAIVAADPGSTAQDRFGVLKSLATYHMERYEFTKAEAETREALRIVEAQGAGHEAELSDACEAAANALSAQDRYEEARALQVRSVELAEKVYTRPHRSLGYRHYNLGVLLNHLKQYDQAIEHLVKAADIWRVVYKNDDHPDLAYVHRMLALIYREQGKLDLAEHSARRAVEIDRKKWGEGHSNLARSNERLAQVLVAQGRIEEARPVYAEYLAVRKRGAERPDASPLFVAEYASALLNGPVPDLRNAPEGLRLAELANQKANESDVSILVLLSRARFEQGDVGRAIEALEKAVPLLKPNQKSDRAEIEERLRTYRATWKP